MGSMWAWIKQHPDFLILIAVVIVGQVAQKLLHGWVEQPYGAGEFPVLPALVLGVMLVLAILVVWLRARLGSQLVSAGARLSLPAPESLPAGYVVADPPRQAVRSGLALLDVVLVLLVAATLRAPALALVRHFVAETWAEVAVVAIIIVAVLVVLGKLFRTGGPVLVLLLWSGLDRVVPTAGFVATTPLAVPTRPRTVVTPVPTPALEPTVVTPQHSAEEVEPTVVAPQPSQEEVEPTVVADATVVSARSTAPDDDATVVANKGEA